MEEEQVSRRGLYEPGLEESQMPTLIPLARIQSHESQLAAREAGKYHPAMSPGGKENSFDD